jgi:hypothetical protein
MLAPPLLALLEKSVSLNPRAAKGLRPLPAIRSDMLAQISFASSYLRDICLYEAIAVQTMSHYSVSKFFAALSDINSCRDAAEILILFGPAASVTSNGEILIRVADDCSLKFVPVGERYTTDDHGIPKWQTVNRLKLTVISIT